MQRLFNQMKGQSSQRKILKEIERTEFKKQALIHPLTSEIERANNHICNLLRDIGTLVHAKYLEDEAMDYNNLKIELGEHYDEIAVQKKIVKEKEDKITEFIQRYDEEIMILRANLGEHLDQAFEASLLEMSSGEGSTCPQCGASYQTQTDIYCTHCGNKVAS